MSSIYRYVVFAPGKQPTVEEVDQLKQWSKKSKQRYAVGISGEDGRLAFVFSAGGFESSRSGNSTFAQLIQRWEVRGCQVRERLQFIKKPTALRPLPGSLMYESFERHDESSLKRKQQAAQEALGLAGLKMHQSLARHAWLHRADRVVPYALIGLSGLLTIGAGIYAGHRLLDSRVERRQQTIRRVADDAMEESLTAQEIKSEPHNSEGSLDE